MGKPETITPENVHELFHYDEISGAITWKIAPSIGVQAGDNAGSISPKGYLVIGYKGTVYQGHRVIWLYMTGQWPLMIDHIDNVKSNNAWANLRECDNGQNQQNVKRGYGASRYRGVSPRYGKWLARITSDGKTHELGAFRCEVGAYAAYCAAKAKFHTFAIGA